MSTSPIIPGFHPDPSLCRVGEAYFLVTSSFEYSPGVPVFTSTDLLRWHQIGNALDGTSRPQVRRGLDGASGGIYAPTIRHHDGWFWVITSNVHESERGHLIVRAADPAGPWSPPVYTDGAIGIDPDLCWGEDGICRLTWKDEQRGGLSQAKLDPFTGRLLSEPELIWRGSGGQHPEGPHVIHHEGWWHLIVAEGGTGGGHMVTSARSRRIDGPYDANPSNPLFTHRSSAHPVQSVGHADLVQTTTGEWAMAYLGVRPRGSFPRWHTNGRETFIAKVDWIDDWPVVIEDAYDVVPMRREFTDTFTSDTLESRWIAPGVAPESFAMIGSGGLRLRPGRRPTEAAADKLLAVRVTDSAWSASVAASGDISLSLRIDDAHQAMVERVNGIVSARIVIGPLDQVVACKDNVEDESRLCIVADDDCLRHGRASGPDTVRLGITDGSSFTQLAAMDGRYLSTEVAGGFTGRVIGIEALGPDVLVSQFTYSGSEATAGESAVDRATSRNEMAAAARRKIGT
jgi:xylan 1,4-beta-xylosidase